MLVRNCMSGKVITVEPEHLIDEARTLLQRHRIRQVPVLRGKRLVGIVTDRNLRAAPATLKTVREVMTAKPFVIGPDLPVDEAARLLRMHKINALPVIERAKLIGILSTSDVLDAFVTLSGVTEPTYRITLTVENGKRVESQIRQLVAQHHGELKWLHRDTRGRSNFVHLRLKARRVDEIVTALEGAGFEVTTLVAPSRAG